MDGRDKMKEFMRIVNVFPQFRSLAGGERLAIKISNLLARKGFKVFLLTLSMNDECQRELDENVELIEYMPSLDRIKNHYWKIFFEHLFVYRLAALIPVDIDVVYFHKSSSLPCLFYYKDIKKGKIPSLYFCYEPPRFLYDLKEETLSHLGLFRFFVQPFYPLLRFLDRRFASRADLILVFSYFMEKEVKRLYKKRVKMIGPLGVDFPEVKGNKEYLLQYGINEDDKILLTVNRLQPRKRIDILIEAIPFVRKEYPNIKVLIIGSGPEERNLKGLVRRLNIGDVVKFLGYIEEDELPTFYANADIYIHLAKNEPFGLSVLEAMSFGKPVISVYEGNPAEIIKEGETGLFVRPQPADLGERINYLLRNEAKRRDMGLKAAAFVRNHYNWEDFIERFIASGNRRENVHKR